MPAQEMDIFGYVEGAGKSIEIRTIAGCNRFAAECQKLATANGIEDLASRPQERRVALHFAQMADDDDNVLPAEAPSLGLPDTMRIQVRVDAVRNRRETAPRTNPLDLASDFTRLAIVASDDGIRPELKAPGELT